MFDANVLELVGRLEAEYLREEGQVRLECAADVLGLAKAVTLAPLGEVTRRGSTVLDVDLAPAPAQAVAVLASVAGAAAVVEVDERDAAAREELHGEVERRLRVGRRPAVHVHEQRGQLVLRAG